MNGKKNYYLELKVKESNGEHYTTIDQYKKISPEAAVILITMKYVNKKAKKGLMHKLDVIYNEVVNEIEKALQIR